MSASHTVAQKKAAAQTAVAAKPVSSKATGANGPLPLPDDGTALRTPSWTAIVEAYHREGNGDREMLLALLHAKAKEDERLAALDLLRAEQLRAYTTHIAIHGPLLYPGAGSPISANSSSNGASSPKAAGAMPMPMNGPLGAQATFAHPPHHHHHAHPHAHAHAHAYYAAAAAAAPPPSHHTARAHAASTSAGSTASTSTSSSAASSSSSRGRKNQATATASQARNQTRDNASRSPSLSHTAESRLSSPESIARTPIDERRLSDFALAASAISEKERGIVKDGGLLVVPSLNAAAAAAGKRKAGSMEIDDQQDDDNIESIMTISAARPSKRASPARSLPSISTSLPTPTCEEDAGQQQQQRRACTSPKLAHAKRSSSPRSLQQILNSELRPLSLSSFKVATSDLRGSASDDEDELAEE